MNRKLNVVSCPKCGREYLPAEIFIPKHFFGNPDIIQRNLNGSIENFSGTSLDTDERYVCDNCNTTFNVHCELCFTSCVEESTVAEYVSQKSRFTMKEF